MFSEHLQHSLFQKFLKDYEHALFDFFRCFYGKQDFKLLTLKALIDATLIFMYYFPLQLSSPTRSKFSKIVVGYSIIFDKFLKVFVQICDFVDNFLIKF